MVNFREIITNCVCFFKEMMVSKKKTVVNGGSGFELWIFMPPMKWGAIWSYQEFPKHIITAR